MTSTGALLIDVSSLQGEIDWKRVAAWRNADGRRIVGVYCRSNLGTTIDSRCARYLAGAREAGLLVGVYGVLVPGGDPIAHADALAAAHVTNDCELPPWLDFELGHEGILPAAEKFVERVEERTRRVCVVYTGWGFWTRIGNPASTTLSTRPLAVAHYTSAPKPLLPRPWSTWTFWQYSGDGGVRIDGISVDVDHDVFNGDEAALRAWLPSTHLDPPVVEQAPGVASSIAPLTMAAEENNS